nr:MAG TPA: hypothetical protein [Caudoviricetes sp.]
MWIFLRPKCQNPEGKIRSSWNHAVSISAVPDLPTAIISR